MKGSQHTAFIALGANLGEPLPMLQWARGEVARLGEVAGVSRLYRTAPVGGPPGQPDYLNAALKLETKLSPAELMTALHSIEARAGRERRQRWEARVLDLDLILYDDLISDEETPLTLPPLRGSLPLHLVEGKKESIPLLPHPRAWERAFVLAPLNDLEGQRKHPRTGESVADALSQAEKGGIEVMLTVW